jgi:NitT/TauT family transport system substrate-binding protein
VRLVRLVQANAPLLVPARAPLGAAKAALLRRGPRSRARSAAIATLAVATLAAGCSAGTAGSGGAASGTSVITVAAIRGVDNAPLYLAAHNGVFARAGLDVKIRPYQSVSQELAALQDGKVDVAVGDYVDFFYAQSKMRHPDLRIVADGYHAVPGVMEVLAKPSSNITTPQDLVGKTVGTPEPQGIPDRNSDPYSLETLATQSVLANDNVQPQGVTWDPMPSADLIKALKDHKVDAILVQEPYIYQAESELGAVEVLDSCSGATASLPLSGYFAVNSFATAHTPALLDFRSALERAQASAVLPGPVRTVLASAPGMTRQSSSLVTIGAYPTTLDAAAPERVESLMFSFDMLSPALNVESMILR